MGFKDEILPENNLFYNKLCAVNCGEPGVEKEQGNKRS